MDGLAPVCLKHPERDATWVCTACDRWQCDKCARPLTGQAGGPRGCAHCKGILKVGQLPTKPDTLQQLVLRQLSPGGIITVAALSVPGVVAAVIPLRVGAIFGIIYISVLAGFYYQTVAHVGSGKPGLPYSSEIGVQPLWTPLLRAGFILLGSFGPALGAFWWVHWGVALPLAVVGVGIMPAALLSGYLTGSTLNQLWPPALYEIVQRAPKTYAKLTGMAYVTIAVWIAAMAAVATALGTGLIAALVLAGMNTMFAIFHASLFGRFMQEEGERSYGLRF